MTDLYKEAILEAKKLKEIAEEDAKKSIIEAISPYIKRVITKQISESGGTGGGGDIGSFFLEQDEDPLADPSLAPPAAPPAPGADVSAAPPATDPAGLDLSGGAMAGDSSTTAPISSGMAASGEDVVNAAMPDADGKITVDFEDLFSSSGEEDASAAPITPAPGAADQLTPPGPDAGAPGLDMNTPLSDVAPVPGEEEENPMAPPAQPLAESTNLNSWKNSLHEVSSKIDSVYFSKNTVGIVKESLKTRLFQLLESLDKLKDAGKINSQQIKINENKLEFLFLKLKDAELKNSYIENDLKEEKNMTSLKEYAARLFEESYAEQGDKAGTNQSTTASAKHAADKSGVAPDVELQEEMLPGSWSNSDSLPGTSPKPPAPKGWEKGEAGLKEKDQDKVIEEALASIAEEVEAKGHAGFGDTDEDPSVEFDMDEKELKEAIRQIRKESIKKKMAKLREASDAKSWEDGEPEKDEPAKKNLSKKDEPGKGLKAVKGPGVETMKENDFPMGDEDHEEPDADDKGGEPDMDSDDMGSDMSGLGVDSDEDDMMGGDMDDGADLVINIDLPDEVEDALADVDVGALDDISVSLSDVNLGQPEGGMGGAPKMLQDDEPEMDETAMMQMRESFKKRQAMLESKVVTAAKAMKNYKSQVEGLKAELQEANLFIAKNVYFTKFLQRGDLSKANLEKIVEHLDRAKTVQETKEIYSKIKNKLAESAVASKKLVGSSSKVTAPGSAVSLNENVNRASDEGSVSSRRWQELAGIKTTNDK